MKFIHAADLHVDSPLRGLDSYDGAPVERLRGATRQSLIALVDLAIKEQVELVIFAGDIYDGNWADFRTGLFFRDQMVRLRRAGIVVFIVKGNHDAESQITKQLPEVEGVYVFSALKSETFDFEDLAVAVCMDEVSRIVRFPKIWCRSTPRPFPDGSTSACFTPV